MEVLLPIIDLSGLIDQERKRCQNCQGKRVASAVEPPCIFRADRTTVDATLTFLEEKPVDKASQLKELSNNGKEVFNLTVCPDEATLIVVGAPRSGTSMVAKALDALGIYLGDNKDDAVYEDRRIARAIEKAPNDLPDIISDYNARYSKWGFKRPKAFKLLSDKLHLFRNPRLIIPFRDPIAIAKRQNVSTGADTLRQLANTARLTLELAQFVKKIDVPVMALSYEKAIVDPQSTLRGIATFSGIAEYVAAELPASEIIESAPERYVLASQLRFPRSESS